MSDTRTDAKAEPHRGAGKPPEPRPAVIESIGWQTAAGILRRHFWAFLLMVAVVPAAAWLAIQNTAPRYTASGSLIYEPSEYKVRELQSILQSDPTTDAVMATQAEILQSLKIAQRVAERGNLYDNPNFNRTLRAPSPFQTALSRVESWLGMPEPVRPPPAAYGPSHDRARDATVLAVRDALHAAPVRFSRVMEVTFAAEDPVVAAAAVNNAMDIYIKDQFRAKAAAVRRATAWLDERTKVLRDEVRKAEDKIATYRAENRFAQGMHAGLDAEKITHLNEDLIRARADLASADARLDAARGRAGAVAQAAIAASVVPLRASLEQLTAQYQAQTGRLGANHPDSEGSRRQIEEARRAVGAEVTRVVAATDSDRRAAHERVTALEQNLKDARTDSDTEARARIPLNAMERDAEALRGQLHALLERIQQTAQQHALETSEAHEISLALPPGQASWPRPVPMMAAAWAAGVLLGFLLVWLLHMADTTLRSGEDVRALTGRPCFALLPEVVRRDLGRVRIADYAARRPLTVFAEQVRAVRAGLWLGVERRQVVAVTGARPGEGKSILALSLARSASLSGERVLLIDCDLWQASQARRLQVENSPGLSDMLRGKVTLTDILHGDRAGPRGGTMHFIPAGQPGADAFGLFMGAGMARLLTEARAEYTLIVLDSPPVQAITEARVLAAVADATVFCIRWRSTPRAAVQHALELLEDANAHVAGIVLTRVDPKAHVRSGYADAEAYHPRYKAYHSGSG